MTISSEKKLKRINYPSENKWEDIVGYSRAVKIGNTIEIAGTTAMDEHGKIVGQDDPYWQAKYIFEKIGAYLNKAGATFNDVVRTRMFVTNIDHWEDIGKAHGEVFKTIKPAATMVEVSRLIEPELLVEIEVTAILS